MRNNLVLTTLRNTIGAIVYIFLVSQIMNSGQELFGNLGNNFLGPFAVLLLFVLSAAVVGGLLFGQAIYLFLEGKKKDGVKSAIYSIGWLFLITTVIFLALLIIKT
ncbi:MAG TPA: hypothetical protein VFD55_02270 [Candidatus Angelobacter sp.]|nr:hypothetical protein [Candidatus Angelobacter sp.]